MSRPPAARRRAAAGLALLVAVLPVRLPAVEPGEGPPAQPAEAGEELTVIAPSRLARPPAQSEGMSVRVVEREELEASGARTLPEALRSLPGIHLTDEQGNGFQQDLSLRGFTVSSVTGLAQGISVFLDGVRINEPAVEEVNFDLIPLSEVERIEVVRGPTAIFGRNTFGGAVHIVTRRGGARPEAEVEADGGSWWRREGHARLAGMLGPLDGYLAAGGFAEEGWRAQGGGKGARAFGKLGLRRGDGDAALSYQAQVDRLQQVGSLPEPALAVDRRQNYTPGDFFRPALHLATLNVRQALSRDLSLALVTFFRALEAEQFNSSYLSPDTRLFNHTRSAGAAVQLDHQVSLGPVSGRLSGGAEVTRNRVRIEVDEEPNPRFPVALDLSPLPRRLAVLSDAQLATGAFAQGAARLTSGPLAGLGATATLRFDRIGHEVADDSPLNGGGGGTAAYSAWVPALGVAWAFAPHWLAAASYTQGFRAPAFLEITCGEPAASCVGLQAGVAPDATFTKLRPVRSQAFEASLTTPVWNGLGATVSAFRIDLRDDIYGVAAPVTNQVYFRNVGSTRRLGLEGAVRVRRRLVDADASYAYTRATFESDEDLATARTAYDPVPLSQRVRRGSDLPLTPRHRLDLTLRVRPQPWWSLEAGLLWVGRQFLRGDEANETPRLPAYLVARAGAEARWREWSASILVQNLLDAAHATFGTYALDGKAPRPAPPVSRFLTPGTPLRVVAGIRWELE